MMRRRHVLGLLGVAGLAAGIRAAWPLGGLWNPCISKRLPEALRRHDLVKAAWRGIDPARYWDGHVHLMGLGDSGSGAWVNPRMRTLRHPWNHLQYRYYLNAGCVEGSARTDRDYVDGLLRLVADFPPGCRWLLLAFDYCHDEQGRALPEHSPVYIPNDYAREVATQHPQHFGWIASIHPYRNDAIETLHQARQQGALAVKWLPSVMNIDPAAKRCTPFYDALVKLDMPLLVHLGAEFAVPGGGSDDMGNPLRLRPALDRGIRAIAAHSASLGASPDLDARGRGGRVSNFDLLTRLLDEPAYTSQLHAELSTITQINRVGRPLETLIERKQWAHRLVNASDHPLPAIPPLFSLKWLVLRGYIDWEQAQVLAQIRAYNPLMFDFVLKRTVRYQGQGLPLQAFHTRRFYSRAQG